MVWCISCSPANTVIVFNIHNVKLLLKLLIFLNSPELQQIDNTNSQSTVSISTSPFLTPSVQSKRTTLDLSLAHSQEPSTSPSSQSNMAPSEYLSANSAFKKRALVQKLSDSDLSDTTPQSSHSPSVARSTSETKSHSGANSPATNSQQLPYLRFECGCEQCSVYDYISGKTCPNPKELPFPKLEVILSQLPPEEIELIEEELSQRTRSIYFNFCSLVIDTFKQLKECVDYSELISHLKVVLKPNWNSPYVCSASKSLKM